MTAGDPWSVTTEAWARLFFGPAAPHGNLWRSGQVRLVLCGSDPLIRRQLAHLGYQVPSEVQVVDDGIPIKGSGLYPLEPAVRGAHAVASLTSAVNLIEGLAAEDCVVVTGPIDKKSCSLAGFDYPGQTEFFEASWSQKAKAGSGPALMVLAGPRLRVGLVTRHLALRAVPESLTEQLVARSLITLISTLRVTFGISAPRVAVCGLNPHAGDQGLFGDEESRIIAPGITTAVKSAELRGATVVGPCSADTVFHQAWSGEFDAVLAMYHDQGLAPLKALHFHEAINLSAGLRYMRLSPDHGPASSLFMTGSANMGSFAAAVGVALKHLGIHGTNPAAGSHAESDR